MDETRLVPVLLTAIASLAGVIAFLYAQTRTDQKRIIEKLDQCESDRIELWAEIAELKVHVKRIENGN